MPELGHAALVISLIVSAFGMVVAFVQGKRRNPAWIESVENSIYAVFFLLTISSVVLLDALIANDFRFAYVAMQSSLTQPLLYRISAFYGGNEGSMLFWTWFLGFFGAIVVFQNRKKNRELMPYVMGVVLMTITFFLGLMTFEANPFRTLPTPPPDGNGLNPLLQNPGMLFHPPFLYLGYVGFTIPFAFAIAALITGNLGSTWIKSTRRWTLFTWFMLTLGIVFGADWAYEVLGWGGYWGWDPVENASLMPWLLATAYLHSVMIQEKKNMLKVWNLVLIILTFGASIFGTFLTRSGVVSSVHAFGQSHLGHWFLGFLAFVMSGALLLLFYRLPQLKSENRLDSFLSRESSFLFNNLLLVSITFTVFWGTLFPVLSEAVTGTKITVSVPFFNRVTTPIGLLLLALTGLCPLLAWRKTSGASLRRHFLMPMIVALLAGGLLVALQIRNFYAILTWALCVFVTLTIASEFWRGTRTRSRQTGRNLVVSFTELVRKNQRRYGGYIVHIGVVLSFIAFAGSAFDTEELVPLKPGETATVGRYTVQFEGLEEIQKRDRVAIRANLALLEDGKVVDRLGPEKRFYANQEDPTTKPAIRSNFREDLYVIFGSYDPSTQTANFKIMVKPLVKWLWLGSWVMGIGIAIVLIPSGMRRRIAVRAAERRAAEIVSPAVAAHR